MAAQGLVRQDRLAWLERAGEDFPFYDGQPIALSGRQWLALLGAQVAAFLLLGLAGSAAQLAPGLAIPVHVLGAVAFGGLPLWVLARVAPGHWRCLFRPLRWRDLAWVLAFLALVLVAVFGTAALVAPYIRLEPNRIIDTDLSGRGAVPGFLIWVAIQVLGEELFTILPFLALMQLVTRQGGRRRTAVLCGWGGSSLLFALAHLPAYNWNLMQCLSLILTLRLVLTAPYVMTKNLWVSFAVHFLYDAVFLALAILVGTMGAPPG